MEGVVSNAENAQRRDELIFEQDLNEVYLLIDFVSGRCDRSLSALKVRDPDTGKELSTSEIVEAISQIRYPPDRSKPQATSRNSAILLLAKDQLSALAQPARGYTIAYTTIFIDLEAGDGVSTWLRPFANKFRQNLHLGVGESLMGSGRKEPRLDLAERTFPGLSEHARKFNLWRRWFVRLTLFTVFMTCLVYWDAGHGRAALERLDQDWKAQLESVTNDPLLLHCGDTQTASIPNPSPAALRQESGKGEDAGAGKTQLEFAKADLDCTRFNYAKWLSENAGKEVKSVFECDAGYSFVHVWCWRWLLSGYYGPGPTPISSDSLKPRSSYGEVSAYVKDNATYWQNATLILAVYSSFIMPMLFALVGALIGGLRRITHLISENALAPRDLVWMQLAVPMGLVAGIAVALFLTPSSLPSQGTGGISSQLTLTASGLGFLAGYAAERVFRFLDSIVNTAFPDRLGAAVSGDRNSIASPAPQN
jgi:hypothetical protein